jgi:Reverse transcriptase (RNA-dependent DNA polymerase)
MYQPTGHNPTQDVDTLDEFTELAFTTTVAAMFTGSCTEPRSLREAMERPDWEEIWKPAVEKELGALNNNGTWVDAVLPPGCKAVGSKIILKIKWNADGSIEGFKAHLVAKGFSQMPGFDYDETFAPVVKLTSLWLLLALVLKENLKHIHQLDVEAVFLNSPLEEEIYLCLPSGIEGAGRVKWLLRSLYGLKQASRVWNDLLNAVLEEIGYHRCSSNYCMYVFRWGTTVVYLAVYVNDMLMLGNCFETMHEHKTQLGKRFKLKDLRDAKYILGIQIIHEEGVLMLS